ncbi:MAG: NUDIX hydrolase [Candidatus Helarchaeota archaeon]
MEEKVIWKGEKFILKWKDSNNFSNLKNMTQSYGFIFDNLGRLLIVNPGRGWRLPGGGIEKNESPEEALIRECEEEADVEIFNIIPLGYIQAVGIKDGFEKDLIRFAARIKKIKKQTKDPAENIINQRKFIKPEEFLNYCPWGKIGEMQLKKAIKIISNKIR